MQDNPFDLSEKPRRVKPKRRLKRIKRLSIAAVIIFAVVYAATELMSGFSSIIVSICDAQVRSFTMSAVNKAIIEVMSQSLKYSDMITLQKNDAGDISLIETNTVLVNKIARETARKSQEYLQKYQNTTIDIPIGQLSGAAALANVGPPISVRIAPFNAVNCTFSSQFESAGINQTRHKIFLNVIADVDLILPTAQKQISTVAEVLVCESLLVGKVPEIYLNSGVFGGKLDLIP